MFWTESPTGFYSRTDTCLFLPWSCGKIPTMSAKTKHVEIAISRRKFVDYYHDRMILCGVTIPYDSITGYGYSFTTTRNTVNLIPTSINVTLYFSVSVEGRKKPYLLYKSTSMPLRIRSKKQKELEEKFPQIVRLTESLLSRRVLAKLIREIEEGGELLFNDIIVGGDGITKKIFFTTRYMDRDTYGRAYVRQGHVLITDLQDRVFAAIPLSTTNAPLLPDLLDTIFR